MKRFLEYNIKDLVRETVIELDGYAWPVDEAGTLSQPIVARHSCKQIVNLDPGAKNTNQDPKDPARKRDWGYGPLYGQEVYDKGWMSVVRRMPWKQRDRKDPSLMYLRSKILASPEYKDWTQLQIDAKGAGRGVPALVDGQSYGSLRRFASPVKMSDAQIL